MVSVIAYCDPFSLFISTCLFLVLSAVADGGEAGWRRRRDAGEHDWRRRRDAGEHDWRRRRDAGEHDWRRRRDITGECSTLFASFDKNIY
jgi:hypothetical protein